MARIDIKSSSTGGGAGSGTVTSVSIATGTTGTNVNATGTVTTSGTLTVNVPVATAVNTGKLTNTDWSTFNGKQDALVSGTNIKTVNGTTILGSGDLNTGNLNGGTLVNFIANLASTSVNLTLNSGNTATYNGSVITTTGTITITLDASLPNGFSITVIQLNAATTTIAGTGGLVIANRQSQTNNNGQYSVVSVIKITNVLAVLGGDTA